MIGQMTIFDFLEPAVGEYVTSHGANICHIMRPAYIGQKVVYDCSTKAHTWFKVGILEKYIPYENTFRSIIFTGKKQRTLLTHRPGIEIYECLPWDAYPKRMAVIGGK